MLDLILVRHGQTAWNETHRYQGHTDVPLSEQGIRQAGLVAPRLVDRGIDAIYASDLSRALRTATIIAQELDLPVRSEPRLREMSFGLLEGLTWEQAERKYPKVVSTWLQDLNQPPQGGETLDSFSSRLRSLMGDLQEKHAGQTVLLVAHGGSLGELLRIAFELPPEKRWAFQLDNASLSQLSLDEDGAPWLKSLNDTCHLAGL